MGKKVKKKAKSGQKEKRGPSASLKTAASDDETSDDGVAVVKDRGLCPHIEKGINMDKLSAKLEFSESFRCEDCRENVIEKRGNKVKGKQGKKGGTNSKSDSKAIWVCLECGHFSCGGVGLPTTPQSHAVRHAKQIHHALAVNCENPQLLWCFPCSKLIKSENKEVHNRVVKLLKGQPSEESTLDVEDVWFGSGSVTSAIKSGNSNADRKSSYLVKGLENLGNTCFFNSVMQNLFAINTLRDYFRKLDESVGPLSASLRKLFSDTSSESGLRGVINPRSLFGSLCTKSPQFRGYQQHDSHELLRCLLDGLSTEELSARKHGKSNTSTTDPTFVDSIFGGQISSTVTCLECKHSSTIYEPFFDLSLSVPTTKPPSKRAQVVTKGKKPKLPPKRSARIRSKISKESVSDQSTGGNSSGEVQSIAQPTEQLVLPSSDSALLSDSIVSNDIALDMGLTPHDLSAIQEPQDHQPLENFEQQSVLSDSFSWMDYIDPTPVPNDIYIASDEISVNQGSVNDNVLQNDEQNEETNETSVNQGSVNDNVLQNDEQNEETNETSVNQGSMNHDVLQIDEKNEETDEISINQGAATNDVLQNDEQNGESDEISVIQGSVNDDVVQNDEQNEISQLKNEPNPVSQFDGNPSSEGYLTKEIDQSDADLSQSSASCRQPFSKDSNIDSENPLQQDSEVLLLTYKEDTSPNIEVSRGEDEISSAVVGDEQNLLDFDGFGDMFNEPEAATEPTEAIKTEVVIRRNSSDSDPDEVDSSNAPVSVESCLAFFMKPELLSKDEHAWQCDNCSKVLREEMIRSKRKSEKSNGLEVRNSSELLDFGGNNHEIEIMDGNVINCESENKEQKMSNGSHENDSTAAKCDSEVSEEEEANSEKLKVKRDATKSILINKAPSVLTVHLKRFSQDARGRLSKLNGHVNFKDTIDLKPYMDPRCNERDKYTYRLMGVVEHSGTMRGGHYVAYIRSGGAWYHASDAYVREVSFEEVLRCEAYILFYEVT
ncbi:hypothetical protein RD792_009715 [Penstemon davidsonii]|uniref:Ubiquitin carboxyl-terminal hydrolase n=1 Tax=Penstemon davidsonii TaxID=160366 RepID=A0ABR0CZZ8_9LAMI|nr:hypothetical protein RD792_009715 [Penstemon davidsonii]